MLPPQNPFKQINVPSDGSCLLWSVAMNILILAYPDETKFKVAWIHLFGEDNIEVRQNVLRELANYNGDPQQLSPDQPLGKLLYPFIGKLRQRMINHMAEHKDDFNNLPDNESLSQHLEKLAEHSTWCDEPEIKALSDLLNLPIHVFATEGGKHKYVGVYNKNGKNKGITVVFTPAVKIPRVGNNHYHY